MRFSVFLVACLLGAAVHAHEGHDHGDEAKQIAASSVAPRFEARSDLFEVVGIMNGKELWLYLDKTESNAPVEQAAIEIESGAFKGKAVASQNGAFKLTAPSLAQPGQHALTITVEAGDESDLLTTTFEMKAADSPDSMIAKEKPAGNWLVYAGVAIALALLAAAVIRMRKRK